MCALGRDCCRNKASAEGGCTPSAGAASQDGVQNGQAFSNGVPETSPNGAHQVICFFWKLNNQYKLFLFRGVRGWGDLWRFQNVDLTYIFWQINNVILSFLGGWVGGSVAVSKCWSRTYTTQPGTLCLATSKVYLCCQQNLLVWWQSVFVLSAVDEIYQYDIKGKCICVVSKRRNILYDIKVKLYLCCQQ